MMDKYLGFLFLNLIHHVLLLNIRTLPTWKLIWDTVLINCEFYLIVFCVVWSNNYISYMTAQDQDAFTMKVYSGPPYTVMMPSKIPARSLPIQVTPQK